MQQLSELFGIVFFVFQGEEVALEAHIVVKAFCYMVNVALYFRKVEVHHKIFVPVLRRVFSDVQALEQLLKVVFLVDVVVSFQHVEEEAFAETTRTDEEQKVACPFHSFKKHGLVDQIKILFLHLLEV